MIRDAVLCRLYGGSVSAESVGDEELVDDEVDPIGWDVGTACDQVEPGRGSVDADEVREEEVRLTPPVSGVAPRLCCLVVTDDAMAVRRAPSWAEMSCR